MKHFKTTMRIGVAVLFIVLLSNTNVLGGANVEAPSGEPPHGLAISEDAPGTKLNGVVVVETHFVQYEYPCGEPDTCTPFPAGTGRVTMRLKKGSIEPVAFFGTIPGEGLINLQDNAAIQDAIAAALTMDILDAFFDSDYTKIVKLKSFSEFALVPAEIDVQISVADVVVAVK